MGVLVSVIVSVYNCKQYIEEMLSSILEQTISDWELIIVDDASTDGTWEILQKYSDSRIFLLRNEQNEGLTKNLNKAIKRAKGKYLVRMDGDDIALPNRLERQIDYMEKHTEVVLSGGAMKAFGKSSLLCQKETDEEKIRVQMLFDAVIFHPTFIIRREALEINEILYNENLQYAQDYNMTFCLSKVGRIANISDVLIKYRVHDLQVSVEKRDKQIICANYTRKQMLKELDIVLSDKEFVLWEAFCLLRYGKLEEEEEKVLQNIRECILNNNDKKEIYDTKVLKDILQKRLDAYLLECRNLEHKNTKMVDEAEKYHALFRMMCAWMTKEKTGHSLEAYLKKSKFKKIAIYGMSDVGKLLLMELAESEIKVDYVIDKNPDAICGVGDLKVYHPQESLPEVDVVIVTAISYMEEIKQQFEGKFSFQIASLEDIVYEL